mgnify:CR=1 FL=1
MDYLFLGIGIVLLLLGGDWLVKGAVAVALRAKISLLVVGMTVVSLATSAPELLVSLTAALDGHVDISFGNILGSNMANISLVLGITALIYPTTVEKQTITRDYWIMFAVSALLLLFLWDGLLASWEGALFIILLGFFFFYQIKSSSNSDIPEEVSSASRLRLPWLIFYLIGGIGGLHFGSDLLIEGAVGIAERWGISQRIIGLTIVSIGTSLPELAACIMASVRGQQGISLGNLVGSNIFNILSVLGFTALVLPLPVQNRGTFRLDFPWLFFIMVVLYIFIAFLGKGRIQRWQGGVLLALYIAYLGYLLIPGS